MNIKLFQHFHIHNKIEKQCLDQKQQDKNIEINNESIKASSDALTAIGRASISFQAKKISPEIGKTILQKAQEGLSIEAIVAALGSIVTSAMVADLLQMRAESEEIIALRRKGKSHREIAKELNLNTHAQVANCINKQPDKDEIEAENKKNSPQTIIYNKIIELRKSGKTHYEISKEVGYTKTQVCTILNNQPNKDEIEAEYNKNNKTSQNHNQIITLRKAGNNYESIAKETGFSLCTIGEVINNHPEKDIIEKIFRENNSKIQEFEATSNKIITLRKSGKSTIAISKELNISDDTVRNHLKKLANFDEIEEEYNKNKNTRTLAIENVIKLRKDGKTYKEIANIVGFSERTLRNSVANLPNKDEIEAEYQKNRTKRNLPEEKVEKMIELRRQGNSYEKIANKLGCGSTSVARKLSELSNFEEIEAEFNKNKDSINNNSEKIIELRKKGCIFSEIAKEINISEKTIRKIYSQLPNVNEIEQEFKKQYKLRNITRIKTSEDLAEQIIEARKQGMSQPQIAKLLKCPEAKISKVLVNAENREEIEQEFQKNYKKENQEQIPENILNQIIEARKAGKSYIAIGKIFGYTSGTIRKYIVNHENYEEIEKTHHQNSEKIIITNEILEEMAQQYREGASLKEISTNFNCANSGVCKRLQNHPDWLNIKKEHNNNSSITILTPERIEKIAQLRSLGNTHAQIAKTVNSKPATVAKYLRMHPDFNTIEIEYLKNRDTIPLHELHKEKIIELREQGYSYRKIENILNIRHGTVQKVLNNIPNIEEIEKIYLKNQRYIKERTIEQIFALHQQNVCAEEIQKKFGFSKQTINTIIQLKENKINIREYKEHQYDDFSLFELQGKIIDFYINNKIENNSLENILDFIGSNENFLLEKNKTILVGLCKELDKIEESPNNTDTIIASSPHIQSIGEWIRKYEQSEQDLAIMHENIGYVHNLLAKNLLTNASSYLENIIPTDDSALESIKKFNNILATIKIKLETPTIANKNEVNNLILYHYYANTTSDEETFALNNAIQIYNKTYNTNLEQEDFELESDSTKEKLGQIINLANILNGSSINQELANEYQEFVDIFKGKEPLKNRAIQALVTLENYFNSDNEQKYLLKNFEPIARECVLDQEVMKIFMDKIYMYSYNSVGPDEVNIELQDSVLNDTNWQKLQPKEKADFIRTMENGIIDRSPKSKGRFNIIKYEGKAKDYQIVELKIDSKWRIFGYQDPNNSKNFIFDSIGLDAKGLEKYQKEFFNTHNVE